MLTEIIAILFFFAFSWMFTLAAHIAIEKSEDNKHADTAISGLVALIITLAATVIL